MWRSFPLPEGWTPLHLAVHTDSGWYETSCGNQFHPDFEGHILEFNVLLNGLRVGTIHGPLRLCGHCFMGSNLGHLNPVMFLAFPRRKYDILD